MRLLSYLFIGILVVHFALTSYLNRSLLISKFDASYWKDKYEQSQLTLPLSPRTIGDDGHYLYEGYRLTHGTDPTNILAEVPPFGKYLIGSSIVLFGNGYWYGAITTTLCVVIFYTLAIRLIHNQPIALAITTLFALDPLLTEQFSLTMLDSLQLATLLAFFLMLTALPPKPAVKTSFVICAGAGFILGLYSNTKIPLFTPVLFVIGCVVLWLKMRKIHSIVLFLIAFFAACLLPYTWYFVHGHSLQNWFGLQKWMLGVYQSSHLAPNIGAVWTTIFLDTYQNLFTRLPEGIHQWTPLWPLIAGVGLLEFIRSFRSTEASNHLLWRAMSIFAITALICFTYIPFWTRYLLLILPFLYLGFGLAISSFKNQSRALVVILILTILQGVFTLRLLFPTPEGTVRQFFSDWEGTFFQDMYQNLASGSKVPSEWDQFYRLGRGFIRDGEIESVHITPTFPQWSRFASPQTVQITVTYATRDLGTFSEKSSVAVVRQQDQWKIVWDWEKFIKGLTPERRIGTTVVLAKRGSIIKRDKELFVSDVPSFMISITPAKVDHSREDAMNQYLEKLFASRLQGVYIHERYTNNTDSDSPVPIGVPSIPITPDIKRNLESFPGVTLTPRFARSDTYFNDDAMIGYLKNTSYHECCSLLYSTTAYDGASGIEKEKNDMLKGINGGSLTINDTTGHTVRTIIQVEKRDGSDVSL